MAILCGKKWQPSKLAQWILTARYGFLLLVVFGRFLQDWTKTRWIQFWILDGFFEIEYAPQRFFLFDLRTNYKPTPNYVVAMWLTLEMICDIRGFSYNVLISKYTILSEPGLGADTRTRNLLHGRRRKSLSNTDLIRHFMLVNWPLGSNNMHMYVGVDSNYHKVENLERGAWLTGLL